MNKDRTCCDGECRQGRQCPLFEPVQDDMPTTGRAVLLVGIVALLAVLAALVT